MMVSKDTVATETSVFCSLTKHDLIFISTNFAARLSVRKRSDAATISEKVYLYLYQPPSEI